MTARDFGRVLLPYCVFVPPGGGGARVGVGVGTEVVDASASGHPLLAGDSLDALLAAGPAAWAEARDAAAALVDSPERHGIDDVTYRLPFTVADYVDFYASKHHATNLGRMFRPDGEALTPNYTHLPIGYHGRAGTVVVSGTDIRRPVGQRSVGDEVLVGPSERLDIEAELGFVVGAGSGLGEPIGTDAFADHVFGVCLLNDWSARDLQAWEYVPLGPFLGKSFATSVSPWIVPLAALEHLRVAPEHDREPVEYLRESRPWGLDLDLAVSLGGHEISRPPFAHMYWSGAQMLAHMTCNGASTRPGDLFASGTVSGPQRDQRGSLIELSWNGAEPLVLPDGSTRTFLEDGDEVTIDGYCVDSTGERAWLGAVTGTVVV